MLRVLSHQQKLLDKNFVLVSNEGLAIANPFFVYFFLKKPYS
jgi:hypothetical protein